MDTAAAKKRYEAATEPLSEPYREDDGRYSVSCEGRRVALFSHPADAWVFCYARTDLPAALEALEEAQEDAASQRAQMLNEIEMLVMQRDEARGKMDVVEALDFDHNHSTRVLIHHCPRCQLDRILRPKEDE